MTTEFLLKNFFTLLCSPSLYVCFLPLSTQYSRREFLTYGWGPSNLMKLIVVCIWICVSLSLSFCICRPVNCLGIRWYIYKSAYLPIDPISSEPQPTPVLIFCYGWTIYTFLREQINVVYTWLVRTDTASLTYRNVRLGLHFLLISIMTVKRFLLTCYSINYRMSLWLHVSVIVWPSSGLQVKWKHTYDITTGF